MRIKERKAEQKERGTKRGTKKEENVGKLKWNVTPLIRRGSNLFFFAASYGFHLELI